VGATDRSPPPRRQETRGESTINARTRAVVQTTTYVILGTLLLRACWGRPAIRALLLGLGTGSLIAAIGIGVVLTYRGSGVVNFANGAVAIFIAYLFNGIRTKGRIYLPPLPNPFALIEGLVHRVDSSSTLKLPHWPTSISLGGKPSFTVAVLVALGLSVVLGLIFHFLIFRPLRYAPPLAKVVASVGLLIVLQSIITLRFGGTVIPVAPILKATPRRVLGVVIPQNQLVLAGIVVLLAGLLWVLFKFTRFGLATRAAAENEKGAVVLGFSPDFLAGVNWVLSTVIAGGIGILASPITALDNYSVPLLIVPALGAALLANFTSFGITCAAGIGMGMVESLVLFYSTKSWFPKNLPAVGVQQAIPFLVIIVAMFVRGQSLPTRGAIGRGRLPFAPFPRRVPAMASLGVVACLLGLFLLAFDWRQAIINTLVGSLVMLSLVVLTGFVGQISLAQMAIAGTAGFALSKFFGDWPFPLGPIAAALVATGFGLLIAIPALRVRGVNLAVVTLAAAVTIEQLVFNNKSLAGETGALAVKPPTILGQRVGPNNTDLAVFGIHGHDNFPPNVWFGVFCLVFTLVFAILVANVRRSATGRRFLSVRSNERAAASSGVGVSGTKLLAFALSAFVAGIGGVLSGYRFGSVTPTYFGSIASLTFLAFAYLGGISSVSGAIAAGFLVPNGITFTLLNKVFHISPNYTPLLGGIGLITTAILNPEGIAGGLRLTGQQIKGLVNERRSKARVGSPPAAPTAAGAGG